MKNRANSNRHNKESKIVPIVSVSHLVEEDKRPKDKEESKESNRGAARTDPTQRQNTEKGLFSEDHGSEFKYLSFILQL